MTDDRDLHKWAHQILRYEPETGHLFWKAIPPSKELLCDLRIVTRWVTRMGTRADANQNKGGYRVISFHQRQYLAHRIIWFLHTDEIPLGEVDHLNGIADDNRIANLRAVSHAINMRNARSANPNPEHVVGVHKRRDCGKWVAKIGFEGKSRHLGYFSTFEEAKAARLKAQEELGFGPVHGAIK